MWVTQDLLEVLYVVGGIIALVAFVKFLLMIRKKKDQSQDQLMR